MPFAEAMSHGGVVKIWYEIHGAVETCSDDCSCTISQQIVGQVQCNSYGLDCGGEHAAERHGEFCTCSVCEGRDVKTTTMLRDSSRQALLPRRQFQHPLWQNFSSFGLWKGLAAVACSLQGQHDNISVCGHAVAMETNAVETKASRCSKRR